MFDVTMRSCCTTLSFAAQQWSAPALTPYTEQDANVTTVDDNATNVMTPPQLLRKRHAQVSSYHNLNSSIEYV